MSILRGRGRGERDFHWRQREEGREQFFYIAKCREGGGRNKRGGGGGGGGGGGRGETERFGQGKSERLNVGRPTIPHYLCLFADVSDGCYDEVKGRERSTFGADLAALHFSACAAAAVYLYSEGSSPFSKQHAMQAEGTSACVCWSSRLQS